MGLEISIDDENINILTIVQDYGCSENPEDFDYLIKYSPLHNVKPNTQYPSTLVLTSDHDDRVVPLHSFKFVATLQTLNPNNQHPLLTRIETKAGEITQALTLLMIS